MYLFFSQRGRHFFFPPRHEKRNRRCDRAKVNVPDRRSSGVVWTVQLLSCAQLLPFEFPVLLDAVGLRYERFRFDFVTPYLFHVLSCVLHFYCYASFFRTPPWSSFSMSTPFSNSYTKERNHDGKTQTSVALPTG